MPTTNGKIYLGSTLVAGGEGGAVATDWVRNPAWPALTAPGAAEQRIVGLHAVWPGDGTGKGGNFFAFLAQGAYTIDYGDGTVTNYTSNTRADYEFDFNDPQLAGTNAPVTFTVATNVVNRTAHGLSNGAGIRFYNLANTTGIVAGRLYYVINAATDTFQVAETAGGSAIDLTGTDGSATLLPYKVAVVTITPQAGQNLTVVNFFQKHGQTGLANGYTTGWLDLAMAIPQVSGANLTIGGATTVVHGLVERINIVAVGALTSMASLFNGCRALQSLPSLPSATAVTNMSSMFTSCFSLQTIPPFPGSVAAVTTMASMFQTCFSLQTIPPFPGSVAAVTAMNNMFNSCSSLQTIPPMDASGVSSSANLASAYTAGSLTRIQATGQRFTFSVASQRLSAVALNEIFTGLPTVTGQTITVTGNYGINEAGYNPTIATAKGWTVTA
ncbi:MAG: BspA family leucine-rich repeat surface protein [Planctomycetota bacterium]